MGIDMELKSMDKYGHLSDREIVDRIITEPYDEQAAVYLIYSRYRPLCISICLKALGDGSRLDQLQSELFILLKGRNLDWQPMRTFQWRSTLGRWLSITAYNLALGLRKELIENNGKNISIDNGWSLEDEKPKTLEIPVDDESRRERRYRTLLLHEAICTLENPDQQFVVIKRLQGYSSKEVALMLQNYWKRNNIVRYNNRKEVVVPDGAYIDNLFKRGYDKTRKIYKLLDR